MRSDNGMAAFAHFRTKTALDIKDGQEIEMENTVNAPYEGIKLFGKSERKAEWRQAEGVTTQAGTPSPDNPVDLVSNIPAGSYQIPAGNGIYEVTLTEDLRGIDDTWRDRICFDSVSGTGYLEQNTQKDHIKDYTVNTYQPQTDETLHCGYEADFDKDKLTWSQVTHVLCTHFKSTNDLADKFKDNIRIYKPAGDGLNVWFDIRKEHLKSYGDSIINWINANDPIVILPRTTPLKTALTFTKVESSSLPVLPWTAYGRNLFDGIFESGFYDSSGEKGASNYIRGASYIPVQPNTRYYVLNNKPDDTFLWYDSGKNFLSEVSDLSEPSPANACYLRFFFYGTDKTTQYMLCSGAKPTAYEPFNPTPPEALEVSPDYPQKIYDLSDVTVTSRGKTLEEMGTPFDKYRCTEAKIGLALPCVKLNNDANGYYTHTDAEGNRYLGDYIYKDGNKVYHVKNIATREFTGNETIGNYVHSGLVNKKFYVFQMFGTSAKTYYEENGIKKHWSYTSMMSSSIPVRWLFECDGDWCLCTGGTPGNWANNMLLGLPKTEVDKMAGDDVNAKGKAYWKSLFENGFSCTVKYITEPVITDITDTELGQDLLGLKTAPYYTKLFTDKETGGLRSFYKTFQARENEVLTGYLLTSDGEYVVTNDGKTVIQF